MHPIYNLVLLCTEMKITCKNCHTTFEGKFCSNCGQKNYTEKDKSIKHLVEDAFHFITHFEGAFFTTFKTVFTKPGQLTVDYCNGIRKKYFKPVSLYLLIVVLYLLFPIFKGLNTPMNGYRHFIAGHLIERQIEQKIVEDSISEEQLAEAFEHKSHTVAKFMLLILIPLSAGGISLLFFRKRVAYDNFILATEINIFYLLGLFLLLPLLLLLLIQAGITSLSKDEIIGTIVTILFALYSTLSFHKVFAGSWIITFLKGTAFALLHTFIILIIYKLLVFETTFFLL